MPIDKFQLDNLIVRHLGHFNASVAWFMENGADVEKISDVIMNRDRTALLHMTGQRGYVCDYDKWHPKLVAKVQDMLQEMRA